MQILIVVVLAGVVINILINLFKKTKVDVDIEKITAPMKAELDRLSAAIKNDNSNNKTEISNLLSSIKTELNQSLKESRTELNETLEKFRNTIETKMGEFSTSLVATSEGILKKQEDIRKETEDKLSSFQVTLNESMKTLSETLQSKLREFGEQQKADSINTLSKQEEIRKETETKLEEMRKNISKSIEDLSGSIKNELTNFGKIQTTNSETSLQKQTEIRVETEKKLNEFNKTISAAIELLSKTIATKLSETSETSISKQTEIRLETEKKLNEFNVTMNAAIDSLSQTIAKKLSEFGEIQKKNSEDYIKKHDDIKTATDEKLELVRKTVEERLEKLQDANGKKLDEMRQTVDEKLQQTLNTRLTESFKQVTEQLDKVHVGLGAMTSLANDVGGLKKVLTNVKTRGMIGEIQLESLLNSVLSPDQYECNVQIKSNTTERVEFAIKLPGRDDNDKSVYLPIDSKFPDSAYQKLLKAYDDADTPGITSARKELVNAIKLSAKNIKDKYIDPPNTTEWGILFLPFEGLYAEVLQNSELVHLLQSDYHIMLTGPTTLGAFINSLQMGFKTLAIQKSSSEVWQLLGAVKTQFGLFGTVLDAAQKKIRGAGDDIERLVGTRTRMIQSKLRKVELLPTQQAGAVLELPSFDDEVIDDDDKDI